MRTRSALLAASVAAAAFSATSAQAQDAAQWAGFYAGGAVNTYSLEITGAAPFPIGLGTESGAAIFAGYNHAIGSNFVVGGELAYNFETSYTSILFPTPLNVESSVTLR